MGHIPVGIVIVIIGGILTFLLLENRKFPAGLLVVLGGMGVGAIFLALAVILGVHVLYTIYLIPISILGVLLIFAGSQPSLTVIDMKKRKNLFVALIILGITLVRNLAFGFFIGICVAYSLKSDKLTV